MPGRAYAKIKDIGQGSYGKAVLVQDKEARMYVMKIIDMSRMDSKQRKDAVNEVKVLSSLKHPYIVSYRESFQENRQLAIVMDYADGGDLHERISKTRKAMKTFPEEKIVRWFTEATLALKYMHDKHVLHRDLKSQNLFLTSQDRLRIGDFGISKVLENTAAFARTTIGTPYYLSPEICMEKPYSYASDIWALGCILYELAALRVPFDASSLQSLVHKITRGPTPTMPSAYSSDLRQLCTDLLHREQSQRPTAPEILQRPVIQSEIRRMLREEQAKSSAKENEENRENRENREPRRRPSDGSQVSRRPSEGALLPLKSAPSLPSSEEAGDLSARHRNHMQPAPLKGVGASLCENGARIYEPSENRCENREPPRQYSRVPSVPPLPPPPYQPRQHHGVMEPICVGGPSRHSTPSVRRRPF